MLLKVGGTIQDFDDLTVLIRSKLPSPGSRATEAPNIPG